MINNPTFRPYRDYWFDVADLSIHVTYYSPYLPMVVTGTGYGDAEPPEPEEMEYEVFDEDGKQLYDDDLLDSDINIIESLIHKHENEEEFWG